MAQHRRKWLIIILILIVLGVVLAIASIHAFKAPATAEYEYYCPMHPEVVRAEPGNCPICGMTLVKRKKSVSPGGDNAAKGEHNEDAGMNMPGMEMASANGKAMATSSTVPGHATVMIPGELQQRIGVRIGRVVKGPLKMHVDALGIVEPAETRIARVNIKTEGWIEKVFVNYVGQHVDKGDALLSIYSPNFLSTQQELLMALRSERALGGGQASEAGVSGGQTLAEAARRRLELWDVPPDEIDRLQRTGKPETDLILKSPIAGTVLERHVYEKQYVTPDKELYVIGDLSTVWVQAGVYEYEIPHVELGKPATVTIPSLPDRQFTGKVVFIQPTVQEATRTVQVRIELPNQEGIFKPGMFAQIAIAHPMGDGLLVPATAILRTGERDIAYRFEPGDHFVPVEVKISPIRFGDDYQVLQGLSEGEQISISANFLIDSESRIRMGGGGMEGMAGMEHDSHGEKSPPAKEKTSQNEMTKTPEKSAD